MAETEATSQGAEHLCEVVHTVSRPHKLMFAGLRGLSAEKPMGEVAFL